MRGRLTLSASVSPTGAHLLALNELAFLSLSPSSLALEKELLNLLLDEDWRGKDARSLYEHREQA